MVFGNSYPVQNNNVNFERLALMALEELVLIRDSIINQFAIYTQN